MTTLGVIKRKISGGFVLKENAADSHIRRVARLIVLTGYKKRFLCSCNSPFLMESIQYFSLETDRRSGLREELG